MADGYIEIKEKLTGKFPRGTYVVSADLDDQGNFRMDTFNSSGKPSDDFILGPNSTPIFIYNYTFIGHVNNERTRIENGKFDIINNHGEATSGCWTAERAGTETQSPTPEPKPTRIPTIIPLPDPSEGLKQLGFQSFKNDKSCVVPVCMAYSKSDTGLIVKTYGDGSMFSIIINRDPRISTGWLEKLLTQLYPDLSKDILKAIPKDGPMEKTFGAQGGNAAHKWDVSGVWGITITININPVETYGEVDQPANNPTNAATPLSTKKNGVPVIQVVDLRKEYSGENLTIFQDIIFDDSEGDVIQVDYEIVASTVSGLTIEGGSVDIPPAEQKTGALITGQWGCGSDSYEVTLQATLTDAAGNHSQPYEYTMKCGQGD